MLKRREKPQYFVAENFSQKSIKKALTSSKPGAILRITRAKLGRIDHVGKDFFVVEYRQKNLDMDLPLCYINQAAP